MSRPRKDKFAGWLPGLYKKTSMRSTLYYTLRPTYYALGNDLAIARRKLIELQEKTFDQLTIGGLLDRFMKYREDLSSRTGRPAPATIKGNLVEIKLLKETFGHMLIGNLNTQHVWRYLHEERGRVAPVRANREVSLLATAYRFAVNRGLASANPCIGVEKNVERPRERAVSIGELDSFCLFVSRNEHLSAAQRKRGFETGRILAFASRLAFLTAKAESQVLGLQMNDVRVDGIHFGKRKHGHATIVEWTPALRECVDGLLALRAEQSSAHVVQNQSGQAYTLSGFIGVWRRAMLAWVAAANGDESRQKFTFHDLRAMSITHLKSQGRDPKLLSGHTTDLIPDRVYDRRKERRAKAAM
jgi:integrase